MENKHTIDELRQWQSLPLELKIRMTATRIRGWIDEFGEDGSYISFSGGKDSTVLLDIVRNECGYKKIPAVFIDVPTQYPELKQFAMGFDNVEIVTPKISFMQVCEKYGFPLISKEVSECVQGARKYLTSITESVQSLQTDRQTDRQTDLPYAQFYRKLLGTGEYRKKFLTTPAESQTNIQSNIRAGGDMIESTVDLEVLANLLNERKKNRSGGSNQRLAQMLGLLPKDKNDPIRVNIPESDRSAFSQEKYKFFLEAPFEISNRCCNVMKKNPAHDYYKRTGRTPITAQMADESRLRTQKWLMNGCNGFNLKIPTSNPMSFWTEQDVLEYIKTRNLPICSVYGEVVKDFNAMGEIEGQLSLVESKPIYKTTGCQRTGCMLCGFGCHLEKPGEGRFEQLKQTHPKMYGLLDIVKNNGVTFREAIEWTNEHSDINIRLGD